ncbi:hypothetical protein [Burkholderia sp. Bp8992]|uniref:hypothetical protein n=1 Tax=Burkholderia sp. Bp8992 TaxID=2184554 RepID=UPI0021AB6987|nr:hypothetical protein [Burkholderia sp. Bp8992]
MTLCEASSPASNADSPVVPAASPARPKPCPIALTVVGKTATGTWDDGRNTLPITLNEVGRLNDNDQGHFQLDGTVDIPMWYRTKTHMLVGTYALSDKCGIAMQSLRAVNIATGRVDRTITLGCDAGMVMTAIYANVADARRAGYVSVESVTARWVTSRTCRSGRHRLRPSKHVSPIRKSRRSFDSHGRFR